MPSRGLSAGSRFSEASCGKALRADQEPGEPSDAKEFSLEGEQAEGLLGCDLRRVGRVGEYRIELDRGDSPGAFYNDMQALTCEPVLCGISFIYPRLNQWVFQC